MLAAKTKSMLGYAATVTSGTGTHSIMGHLSATRKTIVKTMVTIRTGLSFQTTLTKFRFNSPRAP